MTRPELSDDLFQQLDKIDERLRRIESASLPYGLGPPTHTPPSPQLYLDVTNFRAYFWTGLAWKYTQLV